MPGSLPSVRPPQTPPAEIDQTLEAQYVEQLFCAYGDHLQCAIGSCDDLAPHNELAEHFQLSRRDFYCAEALRDLTRDSVPPGSFEDLQEDMLDGVRNTARAAHPSGYVRVTKTTDQAVNVQLPVHVISSQMKPRERMGICHQLANQRKLIWVP
jgi:hypothetical protein